MTSSKTLKKRETRETIFSKKVVYLILRKLGNFGKTKKLRITKTGIELVINHLIAYSAYSDCISRKDGEKANSG
eukprot:snap_masked-scaffold_13-processed-gene-1.16-mRNA-1 protein AED:1.00 eAED:1.00 QI:0/0/0/0/1/1/4/0/73